MDRNEAAIILDRRTTIQGDGHTYEQINEAIDMAISALRSDHTGEAADMMPFTLEQLRGMNGKPVWIVESPDWGHWELSEDAEDYLCDRDTDLYGLTYPDPEGKAGLHKLGWLAYAYPPAHIDREAWEPCESCMTCDSCKNREGYNPYEGMLGDCGTCYKNSNYEPDNFCRECGRPLTPEAWAELEKRLRGRGSELPRV